MMKMSKVLLCVMAGVAVPWAVEAHPGGHGDEVHRPVLQETAIRSRMVAELEALVLAKKVDETWKGVAVKRVETIQRHGRTQWVATLENPKAAKDRELFLFTNIHGDMVDGGFAMNEAAARTRAAEEVARLVGVKKVPATWQALTPTSIERRVANDRWEWVVIIDNPGEETNKKLFVFLKPWGDFVAANFTGK